MPAKSVTQAECKSSMSIIMEEIKWLSEKITDLALRVEWLPQKMLELTDERYASKRIEKTVDNLNWLVISTVVAAILSLVFFKV